MKKLFPILFLTLLTGCLQTTVLKNGYSQAPVNPKVFQNKASFDKSILAQIDTTVIYEEFLTVYYNGSVQQQNILARNNHNNRNTIYGVYRFYGNGNYNLFHLDRNDTILTQNMFDPAYTGWRGVLYLKKGKITGDLITQTGQLGWQIGKQTQEFTVHGDTLYVTAKNRYHYVYIKRSINPELLKQHSNW